MKNTQTGATLLVSLLILIVLSVIGVAAMRGGLLQAMMASNTQQSNAAFYSAESAIGAYVSAANAGSDIVGDPLFDTLTSGVGVPYTRYIDGTGALNASAATKLDTGSANASVTSRVTAQYTGVCLACPGYSTSTDMKCHVYQIDGQGTIGDATTTTTLWATEIAPCG